MNLEQDEIIGAVNDGEWKLFATTPTEWRIAAAGSPAGQHLLRIDRDGKLSIDLTSRASHLAKEDIDRLYDASALPSDLHWLYIVVDVKRTLYVNGFFDLALEECVPEGWKGIHDDPYKYVPQEIASCWKHYPVKQNISRLNELWNHIGSVVNRLLSRKRV